MESLNLPSILTPDFGLLFWMLLAFVTLFCILAKYAFPMIIQSLESRKAFIEESLMNARAANEKLANIQVESERILKTAREQQAEILKTASETRNNIINEARKEAVVEGTKLLNDARAQIQIEKTNALRDIRQQVAQLSIQIAEKIVKHEIERSDEQNAYINNIIDKLEQ